MTRSKIDGVLSVRPYGFVRPQTELLNFCAKEKIPLVFDSAAALGGKLLPKIGGELLYTEVFSLHATKAFGIGEGGAIVCPSSVEEAIRRSLNFGFHPDKTFDYGLNGKMSEVHAAIALAQLERINDIQNNERGWHLIISIYL